MDCRGVAVEYSLRSDYDAVKLREEAEHLPEKFARRLRSIAALYDGDDIADVARRFSSDPATIRKWLALFAETGTDGVYRSSNGGRPGALRADHDGEILRRLSEESVSVGHKAKLLALALLYDGLPAVEVARLSGVSTSIIGKWRREFNSNGVRTPRARRPNGEKGPDHERNARKTIAHVSPHAIRSQITAETTQEEAVRLEAVALYHEGRSLEVIADIIKHSRPVVWSWVVTYDSAGPGSLDIKGPTPGNPRARMWSTGTKPSLPAGSSAAELRLKAAQEHDPVRRDAINVIADIYQGYTILEAATARGIKRSRVDDLLRRFRDGGIEKLPVTETVIPKKEAVKKGRLRRMVELPSDLDAATVRASKQDRRYAGIPMAVEAVARLYEGDTTVQVAETLGVQRADIMRLSRLFKKHRLLIFSKFAKKAWRREVVSGSNASPPILSVEAVSEHENVPASAGVPQAPAFEPLVSKTVLDRVYAVHHRINSESVRLELDALVWFSRSSDLAASALFGGMQVSRLKELVSRFEVEGWSAIYSDGDLAPIGETAKVPLSVIDGKRDGPRFVDLARTTTSLKDRRYYNALKSVCDGVGVEEASNAVGLPPEDLSKVIRVYNNLGFEAILHPALLASHRAFARILPKAPGHARLKYTRRSVSVKQSDDLPAKIDRKDSVEAKQARARRAMFKTVRTAETPLSRQFYDGALLDAGLTPAKLVAASMRSTEDMSLALQMLEQLAQGHSIADVSKKFYVPQEQIAQHFERAISSGITAFLTDHDGDDREGENSSTPAPAQEGGIDTPASPGILVQRRLLQLSTAETLVTTAFQGMVVGSMRSVLLDVPESDPFHGGLPRAVIADWFRRLDEGGVTDLMVSTSPPEDHVKSSHRSSKLRQWAGECRAVLRRQMLEVAAYHVDGAPLPAIAAIMALPLTTIAEIVDVFTMRGPSFIAGGDREKVTRKARSQPAPRPVEAKPAPVVATASAGIAMRRDYDAKSVRNMITAVKNAKNTKLNVVALAYENHSVDSIAAARKITQDKVRRWIGVFNSKGLMGLLQA